MKRILILAGSYYQIPLIQRAKERGLYVITCDYLPDNPGHRLADEYHNVSTTDLEGVRALARHLRVDGVATISSDPSIPAVSYVAEAMGLPGPSFASIRVLTDKGLFRALLQEVGLNVPAFWTITDPGEVAVLPLERYERLVVKPVDSSGSKGVTICPAEADAL